LIYYKIFQNQISTHTHTHTSVCNKHTGVLNLFGNILFTFDCLRAKKGNEM